MSQESSNVILENALKIPGWTSEAELRWLAEQASTRHMIAEIGSWKGRSTRAMMDNTPGAVYAVDTWMGTPEEHATELFCKPKEWLYGEFLRNIHPHLNWRVVPLRMPSIEAARCLAQSTRASIRLNATVPYRFDMVFIDGAHDYESVKADILAWRPLLQPGGLICGHDFDKGRPGVVKAVRELFPNPRMAGAGSIWIGEGL